MTNTGRDHRPVLCLTEHAMAPHGTFGQAGGAGGVTQGEQVIRVDLG